jgi:hypothetical protein
MAASQKQVAEKVAREVEGLVGYNATTERVGAIIRILVWNGGGNCIGSVQVTPASNPTSELIKQRLAELLNGRNPVTV